jgi:hypothetical protein
MDGVYPPLTERQERVLKRMELLQELRRPSPWYWMKRVLRPSFGWGVRHWSRILLSWIGMLIFYLVERKLGHPEIAGFGLLFSTIVLAISLFDRFVMTPMQAKIEAARELLEHEQKQAL